MNIKNKIANLFGYEIFNIKKHASLDSHLANLIKFYDIDVIIDVGANVGQFAKGMRKNGFKGEIFSFEPVQSTFDQLKSSADGDNKWHVYKLALGDKKEKVTINVSRSSDLSSILNPSDFGVKKYPKISSSYQEEIEVDLLDSFIHENNLSNNNILLKMDTQGYDLNVFRGGANIIRNVRCILSEISLIPIYDFMPAYKDVLTEYESKNFTVSGIYPVSRNKENMAIIEMDCVLINRSYSKNN
jgi:FkbM family methyltransferase